MSAGGDRLRDAPESGTGFDGRSRESEAGLRLTTANRAPQVGQVLRAGGREPV